MNRPPKKLHESPMGPSFWDWWNNPEELVGCLGHAARPYQPWNPSVA